MIRRITAGGVAVLLAGVLLAAGAAAQPEPAPLPRPKPVGAAAAQLGEPAVSRRDAAAATESQPSLAVTARPPRPRPGPPEQAAASPAPISAERDGEQGLTFPQPGPTLSPPLAGPAGDMSAAEAVDLLARLPRSRPSAPTPLAFVEPGAIEPALAALPAAPAAIDDDASACLKRLSRLGVQFTRLPPMAPGSACHVPVPLEVTSLGQGVAITPDAILNCRTAEGLALWVRDGLVPASKAHLGATPNRVVHDSAYVCRARNNTPGGRLSEHATANAVDIASIGFAERPPFAVGRGASAAERRFEAAIRRESCAYFTTVLGPGSNAAHATHFHFDAAQRRGGYRLCDLGASVAGRAP